MVSGADVPVILAAHQEIDGWRTQASVFDDIFLVFMILGTLVGVIVVGYMLWNAYRYREGATPEDQFDAPVLGELPTGGEGGKKLFLSFGISAIIVISLVAWTYMGLLYVEAGAQDDIETEYDIEIEGIQFGWIYHYDNGAEEFGTMVIPEDTMIGLTATSSDVWHTFGSSELRIKMDAIPGQTSESWILADEQGTYLVECFELCGAGHSAMDGQIEVVSQEEWEEWYYEETGDENEDEDDDDDDDTDNNEGDDDA